jgi:hypothetical protein
MQLKSNTLYQVNQEQNDSNEELLIWFGLSKGQYLFLISITETNPDSFDCLFLTGKETTIFGLSQIGINNEDSMFLEVEQK